MTSARGSVAATPVPLEEPRDVKVRMRQTTAKDGERVTGPGQCWTHVSHIVHGKGPSQRVDALARCSVRATSPESPASIDLDERDREME